MSETTWMVRAGEGGGLIEEFEKGLIAVGWSELGDLTDATTREAIRALYDRCFPEASPGRAINAVSVLAKFRTEIPSGARVITYDPKRREYWIGRVDSDYAYDPEAYPEYPHTRRVTWLSRVGRDGLSATARNSLGSTLTIFAISDDVMAELTSSVQRSPSMDQPSGDDRGAFDQIKEDALGRAHELIKDKILRLSPEDMERLIAAILRAMGYRARVMPIGPDRGVDVFASPDGLGLEEPRIKAEVKHRRNAMGSQEIRSFLGGLRSGDRALYVSTGGFTKDAKYEADRANHPITLIDLDDLASLVVTHYERFDTDGRVLLPLTMVYMPAE
jgi:restriction system protein